MDFIKSVGNFENGVLVVKLRNRPKHNNAWHVPGIVSASVPFLLEITTALTALTLGGSLVVLAEESNQIGSFNRGEMSYHQPSAGRGSQAVEGQGLQYSQTRRLFAAGGQRWVGPEQLAVGAQELVGRKVYGVWNRETENREIGNVERVIVDTEGRPVSVLVDIGGFLGIGARRVAIPTRLLRLEGGRLITDLTLEQARDLPEVRD